MRKSSHHTYARKPSKKHGYIKRQCNAVFGYCHSIGNAISSGLAALTLILLLMAIGEYFTPFKAVINPIASNAATQIVASLNGGEK